MTNRQQNISIHLQDFPDVGFIENEDQMVADMDIVSEICSVALFLRDKKNLRVRLPLNKLTIIGQASSTILDYKDIIADEVNVKNIVVIKEIGDLAQFKLQINFKKVGVKYGAKMKDISAAAANGLWEKIAENGNERVKISGIFLDKDEYEIKLVTKNHNDAIAALANSNLLVQLDVNITEELEKEGLARDVVRFIQQGRKDSDLNISDYINVKFFCSSDILKSAINDFKVYIQEQTLTRIIELVDDKEQVTSRRYNFSIQIEDENCQFSIDLD